MPSSITAKYICHLIYNSNEYNSDDPKDWQLLPRETCADGEVERYPHIPRFLEGEDETKGVPWLGVIA